MFSEDSLRIFPFVSKQSKTCFSAEAGKQQPPKYAQGDVQLQRAGYKILSLIFFSLGTDFPNTLQLHLYSYLPD